MFLILCFFKPWILWNCFLSTTILLTISTTISHRKKLPFYHFKPSECESLEIQNDYNHLASFRMCDYDQLFLHPNEHTDPKRSNGLKLPNFPQSSRHLKPSLSSKWSTVWTLEIWSKFSTKLLNSHIKNWLLINTRIVSSNRLCNPNSLIIFAHQLQQSKCTFDMCSHKWCPPNEPLWTLCAYNFNSHIFVNLFNSFSSQPQTNNKPTTNPYSLIIIFTQKQKPATEFG